MCACVCILHTVYGIVCSILSVSYTFAVVRKIVVSSFWHGIRIYNFSDVVGIENEMEWKCWRVIRDFSWNAQNPLSFMAVHRNFRGRREGEVIFKRNKKSLPANRYIYIECCWILPSSAHDSVYMDGMIVTNIGIYARTHAYAHCTDHTPLMWLFRPNGITHT